MANISAVPHISQPIANPDGTLTRPWKLFFDTQASAISPTGIVVDYAGLASNIPPYWLACGQTVSRVTYSALFAVIGTTYGAGDGTSTFALPAQTGTGGFTTIIKI